MDGGSAWGSVRKIRTLAQIMALLEASASPKSNYAENLRASLVKQHIALESARMRGAQVGRSFDTIRMSLHALTADNLSFLKKLRLVYVKENKLVLSPASKRLLVQWRRGKADIIRRRVLIRILSSDYKAYLRFLLNLERIGGSFTLIARGEKRTGESPLRELLQDAGFKTDVASFFTLRDLFYDFRLVNFVTDKEGKFETLFLTCRIEARDARQTGFRHQVLVGRYRIGLDKRISSQSFCSMLIEGYKTLTPAWARWVSLLDLREAVTIRLRMADDDFDDALLKVLKGHPCSGFRVDGSIGYGVSNRKYGEILKAKKMPLMPGNRP